MVGCSPRPALEVPLRALSPLVLVAMLSCKGQTSETDTNSVDTDPGDTDGSDCASAVFDTPGLLLRQQSSEDAMFLAEVDDTETRFAPPRQISAGVNNDNLRTPMLIDIDNDGSLEVVGSRDGVWVLNWDGCTDTWDASLVSTEDVRLATAIDADMDGAIDLVTFVLETGVGPLLRNDGNGGFTVEPDAYDLSSAFGGYRIWPAQHAADVDGDGDEDFAVVAYDTPSGGLPARVYIVPSNGDGTFGAPIEIGTTPYPANGLDLGDIDGDGDADVLAGLDDDGDPGQIWMFRNQGGGAFEPAVELIDVEPGFEAPQDDGPGFGRLQLWDRTGDGRADLFVAWEDVAGSGEVTAELLPATADGFDTPIRLQGPDVGRSTWIGMPR